MCSSFSAPYPTHVISSIHTQIIAFSSLLPLSLSPLLFLNFVCIHTSIGERGYYVRVSLGKITRRLASKPHIYHILFME